MGDKPAFHFFDGSLRDGRMIAIENREIRFSRACIELPYAYCAFEESGAKGGDFLIVFEGFTATKDDVSFFHCEAEVFSVDAEGVARPFHLIGGNRLRNGCLHRFGGIAINGVNRMGHDPACREGHSKDKEEFHKGFHRLNASCIKLPKYVTS